jgi:hypothetical protein
MSGFKNRVLSCAQDAALDLLTEDFQIGRISKMVKDGEITVDEIADSFKESLGRFIENELDE